MNARASVREPVRTCIACRRAQPKGRMVRFVRRPAGEVAVDPSGVAAGRGAYACTRERCLAAAPGRLAGALRANVDIDQVRRGLASAGVA